ncbi:hypothetical protein J6590_074493 [Homalodisca vitripennis]|nr:hypothetical protein J6590_074493 [Homalodisca vitripennis]
MQPPKVDHRGNSEASERFPLDLRGHSVAVLRFPLDLKGHPRGPERFLLDLKGHSVALLPQPTSHGLLVPALYSNDYGNWKCWGINMGYSQFAYHVSPETDFVPAPVPVIFLKTFHIKTLSPSPLCLYSCELHNCLKTYHVKPSDLLELGSRPSPPQPNRSNQTSAPQSSTPLLACPSTPLPPSPLTPCWPFPAEYIPLSQEVPCMPSSESPGYFGLKPIYILWGSQRFAGNGFYSGFRPSHLPPNRSHQTSAPQSLDPLLSGPRTPLPPSPLTPLLAVPGRIHPAVPGDPQLADPGGPLHVVLGESRTLGSGFRPSHLPPNRSHQTSAPQSLDPLLSGPRTPLPPSPLTPLLTVPGRIHPAVPGDPQPADPGGPLHVVLGESRTLRSDGSSTEVSSDEEVPTRADGEGPGTSVRGGSSCELPNCLKSYLLKRIPCHRQCGVPQQRTVFLSLGPSLPQPILPILLPLMQRYPVFPGMFDLLASCVEWDLHRTLPRQNTTPEDRPDVHALDCEMGFTVRGLELLKVTVITQDGSVKYESLVRPKAEIVDYNTRFSGVKEEEYCGNLRTLTEVQSDMTEFIKEDTILIGHGLEKDLRAFRMVYSTYVDTGVVFPHRSKTILRVTRAPRTPWPVWIG